MKKSGLALITLMLVLAMPALAVRYGIKKQLPLLTTGANPTYLTYSPASNTMYCGNTGTAANIRYIDCALDTILGIVPPGGFMIGPMAYDAVNNRIHMKGMDQFTAIDCATNTTDTTFMGFQGGLNIAYNSLNNKLYLGDDFNYQMQVYSAAGYSYVTAFSGWNGFTHYYQPTNSVYVPNNNPLGSKDSLGVFNGATNAMTAMIYVPGLASSTGKKMAANAALNRLYVALDITDQVALINTSANTLAGTLAVGDNPNNFALCPVNNRMFIACNGSSQYSLKYIDGSDLLDSVQVGDSVSTVVYNPSDSLIYIGCRDGYVKLVDPRQTPPILVDSVYTTFSPQFADMSVDNGGDVYCAITNSDNVYVIGQIPLRIWKTTFSGGQWFNYMSWQCSDDGGLTWNMGTMLTPNCATDSLVTIVAGTTIQQTIGGPTIIADQLVVDGTLEVLDNSLTIADGPGDDIVVNGIINYVGGSFALDPGAGMVVGPTGQYFHGVDGGTVPAAHWDSLSTLNITGTVSTMPAGMDQPFGNVTWDCQNQAADFTLPGGPAFGVHDLAIHYTGYIGKSGTDHGSKFGTQNLYLTSAAVPVLQIMGNLNITYGNVILGGGGPRKVSVGGDFVVYDPAWFYLTDILNAGIDTLFLYGNYNHLAAGIGGGGADSTTIVFCGVDTQNYNAQSEILTGYINYQVNPGAFLKLPEWGTLGQGSLGNFTLMAGAALGIPHMQGIYPTGQDTGAIMVAGTRNYSPGANYCYFSNQTGPYYSGPGLPDTVNQLTVNGMDMTYLSKDVAVMDTLKLLSNYLRIDGKRLSLFGPILQTTGNLMGDGTSQLAIMGGNTQPVTLPGMVRDLGLLIINRPATVSMSDTMLIYNRLELVNGTLSNPIRLSFLNGASIYRSGNGRLAGAGSVVFVNQVGLEYAGGTITAGPEMPAGSMSIMYLAVNGTNDTLIVDRDTLNVWNSLSLSGGLRFNGRAFGSYGLLDTMGPAGELILTDTSRANFFGSVNPLYLPGITGGRLTLDNSTGGSVMRRNITCTGPLNLSLGNLVVGANTLTIGDSLTGSGLLATDSTSSLVFQSNAVTQSVPSTVNNLRKLSWDRPGIMTITAALVIHDTLHLGQGVLDNSTNLTLRSGVTTIRNSGTLMMPPVREGPNDVIYGSHGGGTLNAGNELPSNATDLNNLSLGFGALPNDTVALVTAAQVNGRLRLYEGALSVGNSTLTLRDTIEASMGQLLADSTSTLQILNIPYLFSLPASVKKLGSLILNSPAGMELGDTTRISISYLQTSGKIGFGQLIYGPAATLEYNNAAVDTTSSFEFPASGGPRHLMVSTGGALQLHADRTIPGTLTLYSMLNTGANTVTVDTFGAGVQGTSFVEGNLAKLITGTADTTITYELGTWGAGPSPVSVQVYNNIVPAFVTAGIKGSGHILTNDSTACLKKFWIFSGAGLTADSSRITLNYLPGDFNTNFTEPADESTMVAGRYDVGATPGWYFPAVTARGIGGTSDGGTITLSHAGNFNNSPAFTLARDSMSIFNPAADTTYPYIASSLPGNGAAGVGLTDSVRMTFSEPVRKSLVSYTFVPNPGVVDTAWSADSTTITFSHSTFAGLTSYTVRVAGVQDTAGNVLTGRDSIGFTTMAAPDTIGPYLSYVQPSSGQTRVGLAEPVMISFSEPVDSLSLRFSCNPNPGGWVQNWDIGSQWLTISHNQFTPGVTYSFRVDSLRDLSGNQLRTDTVTVPNPWTFTILPQETLSTAWAGGAYRLVSLPLVPTDTTALGNFGDDLGAYSDSTWRMLGYKPSSGYTERPRPVNGYGYWLASAGNASLDIAGTTPEQFVFIPLEAGWNIIGMPFDTTLDLNKITVRWRDATSHALRYDDPLVDSVFSQRLWYWNDPTNDLVNDNGQWDSLTPYNQADSLRAWRGYAGYAVLPCTLQISPIGAKEGKSHDAPAYEISWQAGIEISSGQSRDGGIRIGVSPQAGERYDRLDAEKPPFIASNIRAYIPHDDWDRGPCREYQYDFRPAADYIEWPLMIEAAGTDQPVMLNTQITGELGNEGYLYLLDRRKGKTFDLKTQKTIGFSGSQELAVVYSSKPFDGRTLTPLTFGLGRIGPNPFIQQTTINYQLPQAGLVSMAVYNITGQRVRTLVSQNLPPGYYSQAWDGRNDGGRFLSAGIYIIRLSASGHSTAQKIVKLQ
jgi:hypothetical protein